MTRTRYLSYTLLLCLLMVGTVSAATTVIINATHDGYVGENAPDAVFTTQVAGVGDIVVNNPDPNYGGYSLAATTQDLFNYHRRAGTTFPTGSIPDNAIVVSAVVSYYGSIKEEVCGQVDLEILDFSPADDTAYAAGDYTATTFTPLAPNISYPAFTTTGWNNFTLDAGGISYISKIANTSFLLDHSASVWGGQNLSETWSSGNKSGYATRSISTNGGVTIPFITITYDVDIMPSVTSLTNTTHSRAISWNWSSNSNIALVMVYQDGVFLHNVTTNYDYWRNLTPSTTYIISTRTVNTTGALNETWVNQSATTGSLVTWPKVMIHFDNGYNSAYSAAYPIMSAYNLNATIYLTESMTETGNTNYLTIANLTTLNSAGWDIANHGYIHNHFTDEMTDAEALQNATLGQQWLESKGLTRGMYHFAYPTGLYDAGTVEILIQSGALTQRTTHETGLTIPHTNPLINQSVIKNLATPVTDIYDALSAASTNDTVTVSFHEITDTPDPNGNTPETFTTIVNYIYDRGYPFITISEWYTLNGITSHPTASFTKSRPLVVIPQPMHINDTSTNTPTMWNISWGDGEWSNSTENGNQSHTFRRPGLFTINMTASNAAGSSYSTQRVWVTGRRYSGMTLGMPLEDIVYSCTEGTFSISRQISEAEWARTAAKIAALCQ